MTRVQYGSMSYNVYNEQELIDKGFGKNPNVETVFSFCPNCRRYAHFTPWSITRNPVIHVCDICKQWSTAYDLDRIMLVKS